MNFIFPIPSVFRFLDEAPNAFRAWNGVYEVWLWSFDGQRGEIIDVGESEDVGDRMADHDRHWMWHYRQAVARESVTIQVRVRPTSAALAPWRVPSAGLISPEKWDAARKAVERTAWNAYTDLGYQLCSSRP